jgi:uncharacterized protein
MEHKEDIIKFLDDNDCSTKYITESQDNDFLMKMYDLFIKNILFEPTNPLEIAHIARYYVCKKDYDNAEKYFLMGIEQKDLPCMNSLGYYYCYVRNDYTNAKKYWLVGVANGCTSSMQNLGTFYHKIMKNDEKALRYWLKGIEYGDNDAHIKMGSYYCDKKDFDNAKKYFMEGIEKANIYSMITLGNMYLYHLDDEENAIKYYVMAMENGNMLKMTEIIKYYLIKKKDYDTSKKYLLMGIDKGDHNAMYYLGIYYYNNKKIEQAKKYLLMAIEKGNTDAMNKLGDHYRNDLNDEETAMKYFEMAIEKGILNGLNVVASYYYTKGDYKKFRKYCKIGLETDNADVINRYGSYYYNIKKNNKKALKYFLMVAKMGHRSGNDNVGLMYSVYIKDDILMEKYCLKALQMGSKFEGTVTRLKTYYKSNNFHMKLLDLYINYEHMRTRKELIETFELLMTKSMTIDDEKQFMSHLSTFKFEESDNLTSGLKLLVGALKNNLCLLDLHFKYSMKGKGYDDAKNDFFGRCSSQKDVDIVKVESS